MTRAMRRSVALGVVLSLAGIAVAPAQELSGVVTPRVRVTAPSVSGKRLIGDLVAMDATTLSIKPEKGKAVIELPRAAITRVELSRRRSRKGTGAAIGALVGLAAGVALGLATGDDCGSLPSGDDLVSRLDRNLCFDRTVTAMGYSLLTVPAGALIGLGAAGGEKWVRTTPDRFSISVKPVRMSGLGAAVSVRF